MGFMVQRSEANYFVELTGVGVLAAAWAGVEVGAEEVFADEAAVASRFTAPYFAASQSRTSAGL